MNTTNGHFTLHQPRSQRHRKEGGMASLVLVSLLMISIVMGVALANWIGVQRRGDLQMRVAINDALLAQSAIQETRFRMISTPGLRNCSSGNSFLYFIDRSTVTVSIDCVPFP